MCEQSSAKKDNSSQHLPSGQVTNGSNTIVMALPPPVKTDKAIIEEFVR